jgi:hypothetical protein
MMSMEFESMSRETATRDSLDRQITEARTRAELFSKSLQNAREQEAMALMALEQERKRWASSFEEKSVMISELERELTDTVGVGAGDLDGLEKSMSAYRDSRDRERDLDEVEKSLERVNATVGGTVGSMPYRERERDSRDLDAGWVQGSMGPGSPESRQQGQALGWPSQEHSSPSFPSYPSPMHPSSPPPFPSSPSPSSPTHTHTQHTHTLELDRRTAPYASNAPNAYAAYDAYPTPTPEPVTASFDPHTQTHTHTYAVADAHKHTYANTYEAPSHTHAPTHTPTHTHAHATHAPTRRDDDSQIWRDLLWQYQEQMTEAREQLEGVKGERDGLATQVSYLSMQLEGVGEEREMLIKACENAEGKLQFRVAQVRGIRKGVGWHRTHHTHTQIHT